MNQQFKEFKLHDSQYEIDLPIVTKNTHKDLSKPSISCPQATEHTVISTSLIKVYKNVFLSFPNANKKLSTKKIENVHKLTNPLNLYESFRENLFRKYRYRMFTRKRAQNVRLSSSFSPPLALKEYLFENLLKMQEISQLSCYGKGKFGFNLKRLRSGACVHASKIIDSVLIHLTRATEKGLSASGIRKKIRQSLRPSVSDFKILLSDMVNDKILKMTIAGKFTYYTIDRS